MSGDRLRELQKIVPNTHLLAMRQGLTVPGGLNDLIRARCP